MGLKSKACRGLETPRVRAAREEQALLMLWAHLRSQIQVTEDDVREGLNKVQWQRFQLVVSDLRTDAKPVSESVLDEYFRLLKIADGMRNKLLPKRSKRRTYAWHVLREETGEAYAHASTELKNVIAEHPAVKVMLFPTSLLHGIDDWVRLNQCGGRMPILRRHMTGHHEAPVQFTRQWQRAAYDFVRALLCKRYPKAAIFQGNPGL